MNLSPIFLYSSWRTGGTALAKALRADADIMLFYDPLNQALLDFEAAKTANSNSWHSSHPSNFNYFEEYLPLYVDGRLEGFPDLSEFRFRNSSATFQKQLLVYLGRLVAFANEQNKLPVFKFEQLEGHVELLREHFRSAIHVGVIRNQEEQFQSWLEQLALGSPGFFDAAHKLILDDSDFFIKDNTFVNPTHREIFDLYYSKLLLLRSNLDLTFNIYLDSRENFLSEISSDLFQHIFSLAFRRLDELEKPLTFENKFIRMRARVLELTRQHDELIRQHDELIRQHDELINSTIWRMTQPIRWFISLIRG